MFTQLPFTLVLNTLLGMWQLCIATSHTIYHVIIYSCCHLAGKLIQKLKEKQPYLEISNEEILCIQIAALCHNLGSVTSRSDSMYAMFNLLLLYSGVGPFSHVFQDFVIPELNTKWEVATSLASIISNFCIPHVIIMFNVILASRMVSEDVY